MPKVMCSTLNECVRALATALFMINVIPILHMEIINLPITFAFMSLSCQANVLLAHDFCVIKCD